MDFLQLVHRFLQGKTPLEHVICVWGLVFEDKPQEEEMRESLQKFLGKTWEQERCQCVNASLDAFGCAPKEFLDDFARLEKYITLNGVLALENDFLEEHMRELFARHQEYLQETEENWDPELTIEYLENFRMLGLMLEADDAVSQALETFKSRRVPPLANAV